MESARCRTLPGRGALSTYHVASMERVCVVTARCRPRGRVGVSYINILSVTRVEPVSLRTYVLRVPALHGREYPPRVALPHALARCAGAERALSAAVRTYGARRTAPRTVVQRTASTRGLNTVRYGTPPRRAHEAPVVAHAGYRACPRTPLLFMGRRICAHACPPLTASVLRGSMRGAA